MTFFFNFFIVYEPDWELRRFHMVRQFKEKRSLVAPLIVALILFYTPVSLLSQEAAEGQLAGYVFEQDGTSPVGGVVVKLMNIESGELIESPESDTEGFFSIGGIAKGVYSFAVSSPSGDFGSNDMIGIEAGKTAKIAISMNPYTEARAAAINQSRQQREEEEGDPFGRVLSFDEETMMAQVLMLKDYEKSKCRIQVKGEDTDFKQKLELMMLGNQEVDEALEGQTVAIELEYTAIPEDYVYEKCTKIPIIWWSGALVILAGSGFMIFQGEEEEFISGFTKK